MRYSIRKFPILTFKSEQEWLDQLFYYFNQELISVVYKPNTMETIYYFKKNTPTPIGLEENLKVTRVGRGRPRKILIEKIS